MLIFDHITRRLGPESNHRIEFESSCAQYTFDAYQTVFRLANSENPPEFSLILHEVRTHCGCYFVLSV